MYELIVDTYGNKNIKKIGLDGIVWVIPFDETNSDYQQYLLDTDGGLPLPEAPTV